MKAAMNFRRQKALDFWACVMASPPPTSNYGMEALDSKELIGIRDAHACFRGIKRPCGSDDNGDQTVAYVLKPRVQLEYELRAPVVFCHKGEVPEDLVFLVYARRDHPTDGAVRGIITHWEFVEACPQDHMLPSAHESRYEEMLWRVD